MAGKKKAYLRRVAKLLRSADARTRAGRVVKDYQKGELAQTVIKVSTKDDEDALREKLRRCLKPHCYKGSGVRHLDREEQRWLLRTLVEAYYTEGYNDLVNRTAIDDAIEELVARRAIPEPWADEYKGKGLYKGQVGSQEKAQARKVKALEDAGTARRVEAIKTRQENLDGGAAAPGLHHQTSGGRQRRRCRDDTARDLGVEPPKASEETAFLRKHGPKPTGCCDGCERPLASSIDALGSRRPVDLEHVNGGHNAGRVRSRCTTDDGCNKAERAKIDAINRSLHAAGQPPLKAEEAEELAKQHLAACYRLPRDDPDYDDLVREVEASQAAAAVATWTERHQRATVASETRSGETNLGGRVAAMALERARRATKPSEQPKARAAKRARKRQERAAKKAKHEAEKAVKREKYAAAKGKPRAPPTRRVGVQLLTPAPAPSGKRERVAVEPYDPATPSSYEISNRSWRAEKARAAKAASKPAKRARR